VFYGEHYVYRYRTLSTAKWPTNERAESTKTNIEKENKMDTHVKLAQTKQTELPQ